ncbi:hypothetical protein BOTBODRAFT_185649 [Botryobasidium botryosum FD-172 SS1]|uniref:Uncharacterized protein n=1 Tax=Botryobasidium botryosum (strain FD-172 SS1) TaxID=930990 RepID=A0A067MRY7_BOTB1|nr:hypothetical protein BOTBODRAFT_185649 [Botryobasidium botryosum FD-172 SS1]
MTIEESGLATCRLSCAPTRSNSWGLIQLTIARVAFPELLTFLIFFSPQITDIGNRLALVDSGLKRNLDIGVTFFVAQESLGIYIISKTFSIGSCVKASEIQTIQGLNANVTCVIMNTSQLHILLKEQCKLWYPESLPSDPKEPNTPNTFHLVCTGSVNGSRPLDLEAWSTELSEGEGYFDPDKHVRHGWTGHNGNFNPTLPKPVGGSMAAEVPLDIAEPKHTPAIPLQETDHILCPQLGFPPSYLSPDMSTDVPDDEMHDASFSVICCSKDNHGMLQECGRSRTAEVYTGVYSEETDKILDLEQARIPIERETTPESEIASHAAELKPRCACNDQPALVAEEAGYDIGMRVRLIPRVNGVVLNVYFGSSRRASLVVTTPASPAAWRKTFFAVVSLAVFYAAFKLARLQFGALNIHPPTDRPHPSGRATQPTCFYPDMPPPPLAAFSAERIGVDLSKLIAAAPDAWSLAFNSADESGNIDENNGINKSTSLDFVADSLGNDGGRLHLDYTYPEEQPFRYSEIPVSAPSSPTAPGLPDNSPAAISSALLLDDDEQIPNVSVLIDDTPIFSDSSRAVDANTGAIQTAGLSLQNLVLEQAAPIGQQDFKPSTLTSEAIEYKHDTTTQYLCSDHQRRKVCGDVGHPDDGVRNSAMQAVEEWRRSLQIPDASIAVLYAEEQEVVTHTVHSFRCSSSECSTFSQHSQLSEDLRWLLYASTDGVPHKKTGDGRRAFNCDRSAQGEPWSKEGLQTALSLEHRPSMPRMTNSELRECGVYEDDDELVDIQVDMDRWESTDVFTYSDDEAQDEEADVPYHRQARPSSSHVEGLRTFGHRRARSSKTQISICLSDLSEDLRFVMYPWINGQRPKPGEQFRPVMKERCAAEGYINEGCSEGQLFGASLTVGHPTKLSDSQLREIGVYIDDEGEGVEPSARGRCRAEAAACNYVVDDFMEEGPRELPVRAPSKVEHHTVLGYESSSYATADDSKCMHALTPLRAAQKLLDRGIGNDQMDGAFTPPRTDPRLQFPHHNIAIIGSPSSSSPAFLPNLFKAKGRKEAHYDRDGHASSKLEVTTSEWSYLRGLVTWLIPPPSRHIPSHTV